MTTVAVAELKAKLSAWLDRVEAGEVITITRSGRAIATLEPMRAPLSPNGPSRQETAATLSSGAPSPKDVRAAILAQAPAFRAAVKANGPAPQKPGITLADMLKASR